MNTPSRFDTFRFLFAQARAVPPQHFDAYLAALDAMDDNGFVDARTAARIVAEARGSVQSFDEDGPINAALWERFVENGVTRYRVAGWWLVREYEPATRGTLVYFVRVGDSGPIKIGRSVDVGQRVATFQTANHLPLRVLATLPGGAAVERVVHGQFFHLRINGEWFRPDLELLEFIRELGGRV